MCQMASDALLAGRSSLASCSGIGHEVSKPSRHSILPVPRAKGFRLHQRLVSCLASPQNSLCCQSAVPVPRPDTRSGSNAWNPDRQVSSPDRWVEGCVLDIVRNIKEAPFLHMLYDSGNHNSGVKSRRQRVAERGNLSVDDKWKELKDLVTDASPDGVILVHHLNAASVKGCCIRDGSSSVCMEGQYVEDTNMLHPYDSTKLWGVLVLGGTIEKSACYILQTTSVASSSGICTQFCLTKAKCFGPSWNDQMQNCWLLNSECGDQVSCSYV